MKKILIIGGGLGGLTAAILLVRKGFEVILYEKKKYPFHRVCGEYISNEVVDFLKRNGLFPEVDVSTITDFQYSTTDGQSYQMPLDLGAFGVSRYYFDDFLAKLAVHDGVELKAGQFITSIAKEEGEFYATDNLGERVQADLIIGAYGKNSNLDRVLDRRFLSQESPYIGVKYHIKTAFPKNLIALHNFESGYCGISAIEEDKYNMCYLGERAVLKKHGSIPAMEENVLCKNPFLQTLFKGSDFLFEKPEVINAFSFAPKSPVEKGVFMIGDAAGLITPLCGNGMALAIHSAKLLTDLISEMPTAEQAVLESHYSRLWKNSFARRLWIGRQTQKLFGTGQRSAIALKVMKSSPFFAKKIMKNTHGEPF